MKSLFKKTTITLFLYSTLLSTVCYAQTGINTKNPRQVLHVDGQGDNPLSTNPTPAQQLNDVVITKNGDVGIGLLTPSVKLDVNGKIRIADLQLYTNRPKKILVADDNGNIFYTDIETIAPPVETRIYGIINKQARQRLENRGSYYYVLLDGVINGINSDKLIISADKKKIQLPPNKTLKITGSIGIIGSKESPTTNTPAYVVSKFELEDINNDGSQSLVQTIGYTESSTETYDDGGVSMPIIIVRTGSKGANVMLQVKYGGSVSPTTGYYIGGASSDTTLGSYILVEEI